VGARRRAAHAAKLAAVALALMLVAGAAGTALAQGTSRDGSSKDGSSWERLDSVLVVPPVYRPDSTAPADTCAEDCPGTGIPNIPNNPGRGELPIAVDGSADNPTNASAGTADNPTDESVAVGGPAPDGSDLQEQQAAAAGNRQSVGSLDSSPGSAQDYGQQAAAQEAGNYGIGPAPYVIIGVPVGSYAPAKPASASPAAVPARSFPTSPPASPAWMPQPMPRLAPLPPMVSRGFQPTGGVFSAGLQQISGFSAGFGQR
jgi:hypothetical protein